MDNKNKYFEITTVASVSARNKAEALKTLRSSRRVPGTRVLAESSVVERIPSATAHALADSLSS